MAVGEELKREGNLEGVVEIVDGVTGLDFGQVFVMGEDGEMDKCPIGGGENWIEPGKGEGEDLVAVLETRAAGEHELKGRVRFSEIVEKGGGAEDPKEVWDFGDGWEGRVAKFQAGDSADDFDEMLRQ